MKLGFGNSFHIPLERKPVPGGIITLSNDLAEYPHVVDEAKDQVGLIPCIYFEGDSSDFSKGPAQDVAKNIENLDRLAAIIQRYPDFKLVILGYAANTHFESAAVMERENLEELLSLSQKRAESIRNALVARGLDAGDIRCTGRGNANPVVPAGDSANQWKNRRVEFILEKEEKGE
ncbi:MAG: OmpA family protein [Spirochaetaceae bacterium]|nr:MAG: OmpA family protein [Spirochaetaceae bacterium]